MVYEVTLSSYDIGGPMSRIPPRIANVKKVYLVNADAQQLRHVDIRLQYYLKTPTMLETSCRLNSKSMMSRRLPLMVKIDTLVYRCHYSTHLHLKKSRGQKGMNE